jgi:hypothetical protein
MSAVSMSAVLDPEIVTRHGETVHEDVAEQFTRLGGELWKEYAEQQILISEPYACEPTWFCVITHSDEDHLSASRTLPNTQAYSTVSRNWLHVVDVISLGDDIPSANEFQVFKDFLHALGSEFFANATRATSDTSTLFSFLNAPHHGRPTQRGQTEWTAEKNHRRHELVDKDIDGTITEREQKELKILQAELVTYRQKVAPLPLEDFRKMHDALFDKATADANTK